MEWFGGSVIVEAAFAAPFVVPGIGVSLLRRKPQIYSFELVAWILPGIVYWLLLEPLGFEQLTAGKGWTNVFFEPAAVGISTGLLFLVRLVLALVDPGRNLQLARAAPIASVLATLAVFLLTPPGE